MIELELIYAAAGALGATGTWLIGRSRSPAGQMKREIKKLRAENAYLASRIEWMGAALKRVQEARDDYAKIAATHEIKPPAQPKRVQVLRRSYNDHPKQNLLDITDDLVGLEREGVTNAYVQLDIDAKGGRLNGAWRAALRDGGWMTPNGKPCDSIDGRTFDGPPQRVAQQICTFVMDDNTSLSKRLEDGTFAWADPDSPLTFNIVVEATPKSEAPAFQTVEVLRIEEKIVERIVEKPVYLERG